MKTIGLKQKSAGDTSCFFKKNPTCKEFKYFLTGLVFQDEPTQYEALLGFPKRQTISWIHLKFEAGNACKRCCFFMKTDDSDEMSNLIIFTPKIKKTDAVVFGDGKDMLNLYLMCRLLITFANILDPDQA